MIKGGDRTATDHLGRKPIDMVKELNGSNVRLKKELEQLLVSILSFKLSLIVKEEELLRFVSC